MANIYWLNAVSGDFNTGTNWSGGTVPGVSDNAVLGALGGTPYTVTDGRSSQQVHTLEVAANVTFDIGVSRYQQSNFQSLYGGGNAGVIDVLAGDLLLGNLAFSNSGGISVGSPGGAATLILSDSTLSGGGQITLNVGGYGHGSINLYGSCINVDNTISGGGVIGGGGAGATLTNGAAGVIDATNAGALFIEGDSITNNGLIEATGAVANTFLDIRRGANVDQTGGGTILAADGAMVILETVQIAGGTLTTVGAGVIEIEGQTLLDGSALPLANKATIDLLSNVNGYSLTLKGAIGNSGSINVNTGAPMGQVADLIVDPAGVTLTGAGAITLSGDGNGRIVGGAAGAVLTNVDNTISGAGYIGGANLTVINQAKGVIDANAAGALTLSAGSTTTVNAGLIEATGAGGLTVAGAITNTGTLLAAGGTLAIDGALTNLVGTTLTGGTLEAAAGSTLDLNSSAKIVTDNATLILSGANSVIQGSATVDSTLATIGKAGTLEILANRNWTSTLAMSNAGTFDLGGGTFTAPSLANTGRVSGFGVMATKLTNSGSLAITGGKTLSLVGGSLTNLSGTTLTGGIYTVGAGAVLQLANNVSITTLNATVDLAGPGATIQSLDTTTSKQVSLASSLTTIGAAGVLDILGGASFKSANSIANAGSIALGGATLTAAALSNTGSIVGSGTIAAALTNSGTLSVNANKMLSLQGGSLTNLSGTTLTGGKYTVGAGAMLQLANNTSIAMLNATIDLAGVGSVVQGLNTGTSTEVTLGSSLTAIGAAGDLQILGGGGFTTANAVGNSGTIQLGGGTLGGGTLTDAAGSVLTGFGTVASTFSDSGTTTSLGGALAFTGKGDTFSTALAGAEIDFAGGTDLLQSGSSLTAAAVGISGAAVVTLGASQAFAGKLTQASGTTMALGANTLTLTGPGSTLAGTVSGTGTLAFTGGTQAIDTGAALTVSNWSLTGGTTTIAETVTYKGAFTEGAGATLTLTAGDRLTLIGATALSGLVHGGSRLTVSTASLSGFTIGGTVIFEDSVAVNQTGAVTVGDKSTSAATLTIDTGATWTIAGGGGIGRGSSTKSVINDNGTLTNSEAGTSVVAVKVADAGAIVAAVGTLDFTKGISGAGKMSVNGGATLEADLTVASTLSMTFNGGNAILALKDPSAFGATINGFAPTDTIDLLGKKATSATLGTGDTLVIKNGGRAVATLQLAGDYSGDIFSVASDGNGGSDITVSAAAGPAAAHPPATGAPNAVPAHQFIAAMAGFVGSTGAQIHIDDAMAVRAPLIASPRTVIA